MRGECWGNIMLNLLIRPIPFMARAMFSLKVVSATFLLVCFVYLNESTFATRKNVYFTLKALFVLEIVTISTFQKFKCHDNIKYLSMKHKTHFTE